MKVILKESQYKVLLKEDRVEYLRNQNVVSDKDVELFNQTKDKPKRRGPEGEISIGKKDLEPIIGLEGEPIAYFKGPKKQIKLTPETYQAFVAADPSRNKEYVQWIIDVFKKEIDHDLENAKRFVGEDLPQATEALETFDKVKKTRLFKQNAPEREGAPDNPKDIRKYNSIAQLSGVIAPFKDMGDDELESPEGGNPSGMSNKGYKLFKDLVSFVKLGQAKMHKLSDNMLIYQPQTLKSSCEPLGSLSTWCTRATPTSYDNSNEYFHRYRGETGQNDRLRPTGEYSDYYVIMPLELFQMEQPHTSQFYPLQFHLESNQFMHRNNSQIGKDGIQKLINDYPEVGEYFRKEIGKWASESVKSGQGLMDNKYIEHLNDFGGSAENYISDEDYQKGVDGIKNLAKEYTGSFNNNKYLKWLIGNSGDINITDYISENANKVDFSNFNLKELPDMSMFDNITKVIATNSGLYKFPNGNQLPKNIKNLSISNNGITDFTFDGFGSLNDLEVILAIGNPVNKINIDNVVTTIKNNPNIITIKFGNEIKKISNYDEYIQKLEALEEEIGDEHFPMIDPWDFSSF
jgi:hypothetical protein